jgi:hypothetical protein
MSGKEDAATTSLWFTATLVEDKVDSHVEK